MVLWDDVIRYSRPDLLEIDAVQGKDVLAKGRKRGHYMQTSKVYTDLCLAADGMQS
jgi:hypothetical protein